MAIARPALIALSTLVLSRLGLWALWQVFWTTEAWRICTPLFITLIVLDLALLALAFILLWQAAQAQRGSGLGLLLYGLAIAALVTGLTNLINHTAQRAEKPAERVQVLSLLPVARGTAILSGPLDFDAYNALDRTLASDRTISRLELTSDGGRIAAARGLARLVMEHGLETHIEDHCASACTIVFAAGTRRTMAQGARIGFHGYKLNSTVRTLDAKAEEQRDAKFLQTRGISPTFSARAFATPHSEMWYPDPAELRAAGILTE